MRRVVRAEVNDIAKTVSELNIKIYNEREERVDGIGKNQWPRI